jgi:hypothetical protein
MIRREAEPMPEAAITVREVLRLLVETDSYPRLGNEDWAVAARMEAAALKKAVMAVASSGDAGIRALGGSVAQCRPDDQRARRNLLGDPRLLHGGYYC